MQIGVRDANFIFQRRRCLRRSSTWRALFALRLHAAHTPLNCCYSHSLLLSSLSLLLFFIIIMLRIIIGWVIFISWHCKAAQDDSHLNIDRFSIVASNRVVWQRSYRRPYRTRPKRIDVQIMYILEPLQQPLRPPPASFRIWMHRFIGTQAHRWCGRRQAENVQNGLPDILSEINFLAHKSSEALSVWHLNRATAWNMHK